jgi:phage gpG-like protein
VSETVTMNVKGLDQLIKALKKDNVVAGIGIIGEKVNRNPSQDEKIPITNAEIGAAHEFGTSKLPQRSFLRVPIADHLTKKMEDSGALDSEVLKEVIAQGTVEPWLRKVAILAESIVIEAFDTGGFGKWKPSVMTSKKNHQTLVETKQLRDSITTMVKEV